MRSHLPILRASKRIAGETTFRTAGRHPPTPRAIARRHWPNWKFELLRVRVSRKRFYENREMGRDRSRRYSVVRKRANEVYDVRDQ